MSDSESEFQEPIPSQPSNAADIFRRNISQTVRAAHAWRDNTLSSYGEELVARLPSLTGGSGTFRDGQVASSSRPRRRRLTRARGDRRKNSHARVRYTALDRPGITRTSHISRSDLLTKGLYRRDDTDVQMPLDSNYVDLCEKGLQLFPALKDVECDLLIGRGRNLLEELDPEISLSDIKATVPKGGFARLWLRPRESLDPETTVTTSSPPSSTTTASATVTTSTPLSSTTTASATVTTSTPLSSTTTASATVTTSTPLSSTTTASATVATSTLPSSRTNPSATVTTSTLPSSRTNPSAIVTTSSLPSSRTTPSATVTSAVPLSTTTATVTTNTLPSSITTVSAVTTTSAVQSTTGSADTMNYDNSADSFHLVLETSIDADITYGVHQLQLQTSGENHHVIVSRENIVQDMLRIYENLPVTHKIQVSFENEMGVDQGGVTKELFALFWERVFILYFKGQDSKVPHIPIKDRMIARTIFPLLGKILEHQLRLLGSLPAELCRSCVLAMAHQDQDVDPDILIEDFIRFHPEPDAVLLERCLDAPSWSASDSRRLLRLYSVNKLTVLPSPGNLRECLLNMAQTELLDSCNSLLFMMRNGMTQEMKTLFLDVVTAEQVSHFFSKLSSTPERVAQLIDDYYERSDLQILEQVVVTHLSNCIREMNQRQLVRFLRWLTGSTSMPSALEVMFNSTVGIGRAPVAHTCGNLIELSTQYETYEDFRSEFMSVIGSDEAFVFSMV